MSQEELDEILQVYKALSDESRLKILGLLAGGPNTVDELARQLDLKPPTVSHHLSKLRSIGLVKMKADGTMHVYSLDAKSLREVNKRVLTPQKMASLVDDEDAEAWERKILRDYFEGERLIRIPTSQKKRLVILRWLATKFEPGVEYPEKEVNEIIKRHHPDCAYLRRELISDHSNLMRRRSGVYWRVDP